MKSNNSVNLKKFSRALVKTMFCFFYDSRVGISSTKDHTSERLCDKITGELLIKLNLNEDLE